MTLFSQWSALDPELERKQIAASVGSGGTSGALLLTRTALSSDQLLHLTSAPVVVVPAPGAGKFILVTDVVINYTFGSVPYVSTGLSEGLYWQADLAANGPDQSAFTMAGSLGVYATLTGSTSGIGAETAVHNFTLYPKASGNGPVSGFSPENQAVVFGGELSEMTSGDGTATLTVFYLVVDLTVPA